MEQYKNKVVLLFDIDGTLTSPRQPLERRMADVLRNCEPFCTVGGTDFHLLEDQFFKPLYEHGFRGMFHGFTGNGATHHRCDYSNGLVTELQYQFQMREYLGDEQHEFLMRALEEFLGISEFAIEKSMRNTEGKLITDRVSMVNVCPIARLHGESNAQVKLNRKRFVEFDTSTQYRKRALQYLERELVYLIKEHGLKITYGGETSFDIGIAGKDKTLSVQKILEAGAKNIIFIGDALFPGGNDYCISEFIDNWEGDLLCPVRAIQTESWEHTIEIIKDLKG